MTNLATMTSLRWSRSAPLVLALLAALHCGPRPALAQTAAKGGANNPKPPIRTSPLPPEAETIATDLYRKLAEAERAKLLDGARSLAARAARLESEQAALDAARSEAQQRFSLAQGAATREMQIAILSIAGLAVGGEDLTAWAKNAVASSPPPPRTTQPDPAPKTANPRPAAEKAAPIRALGEKDLVRRPIKRLGKRKPAEGAAPSTPAQQVQRLVDAVQLLLSKAP